MNSLHIVVVVMLDVLFHCSYLFLSYFPLLIKLNLFLKGPKILFSYGFFTKTL